MVQEAPDDGAASRLLGEWIREWHMVRGDRARRNRRDVLRHRFVAEGHDRAFPEAFFEVADEVAEGLLEFFAHAALLGVSMDGEWRGRPGE